jgi:DNA-binding response OmpR family regulator
MPTLSCGRALFVSDDEVFSQALQNYVHPDGLELIRVRATELVMAISTQRPDVVLLDIGARSMDADLIMLAATRAVMRQVPCLIMSSQERQDLKAFAAVIRAADVISKRERLANIAARLRMWVATSRSENTPQEQTQALSA